MKLTNTEQIAILATSVVLSFVAGFYVRGATIKDAIVIETETDVSAVVQETEAEPVSDTVEIPETTETPKASETDVQYSAAQAESDEATDADGGYSSEARTSSVSEVEEPQSAEASGLLDLNTASAQELETLPGIGPVLAQRIIDYREANGGFQTVEEVLCVSGIGEKTFEKIADFVEVRN